MKWNWQLPDWPHFSYKHLDILDICHQQFHELAGEYMGSGRWVDQPELTVDLLCDEALNTSRIEGEYLNRHSLRSSIKHRLGLAHSRVKVPPAEAAISQLMVENLQHFNEPVSEEMLCDWHLMLTNHLWQLERVGAYREHQEDMQIVSGAVGHSTVHFIAPPSDRMAKEMPAFVQWVNQVPQSPLVHIAIAHVYLLAIHPFEDGNGRIARALTIKLLSQYLKRPYFILLSDVIARNKKRYYASLQKTNRRIEITDWIVYFVQTIIEAQKRTQALVDLLIAKSNWMTRHSLNVRQEKVLKKLFDAGLDGFEGGLSAKNYMQITQAAATTTTRDLQALVAMGLLRREGKLKATRYYLNLACT